MRGRLRLLVALVLLSGAPLCAESGSAATGTAENGPPSVLVEHVERSLAQVHVTVSGPADRLDGLGREDFAIWVRGIKVEEFTVDRLGTVVGPDGRIVVPGERSGPAPATYLFYFDQPLLKSEGRRRSLELARELVPLLITGDHRAIIVSNGRRLEFYADATSDVPTLLDALDRIEQDLDQLDGYAASEEQRIAWIVDETKQAGVAGGMVATSFIRADQAAERAGYRRSVISNFEARKGRKLPRGSSRPLAETNPLDAALAQEGHARIQEDLVGVHKYRIERVARTYYREEMWVAQRSLQRLRAALAHLYSVDPPKSVLYFADIFRTRPGEHYLRPFGPWVGMSEVIGFLDGVLNDAAASGVRFFTVQAEGLATTGLRVGFDHVRDAQEGLAQLAAYTGGLAFLNGVDASRIGASIKDDLSSTYVLSFDPTGYPKGENLPVRVKVRVPGLEARHRGRLVLRTDEQRRTSRLLAAFSAPDTVESDVSVRPIVIPAGYRDGAFSAVVQVAVQGSETPHASWDLGASILAPGDVREASSRVSVDAPGVPVVLQQPVTFPPGPYQVVAVAHDLTRDRVAAREIEGGWPRLDEPAWVGPVTVLQPSFAAIRQEDRVKTSGAIAYAEDEPVRTDRPTAMRTLVCAGQDHGIGLRVERELVGEAAVAFPVTEADPADDACILIQDLVPAGTMTPGWFRYEIRVFAGMEELARASREFAALAAPSP